LFRQHKHTSTASSAITSAATCLLIGWLPG